MPASASPRIDILDVRAGLAGTPKPGSSIRDDILAGLAKPAGEKTIPTLLLYDERGLKIYDEITTDAPEYYLFPAEERILKHKADEIVKLMHAANPANAFAEEAVVELGAG